MSNSSANDIKNFWASWFVSKGFVVFVLKPLQKTPVSSGWQNTKPITSEAEKKQFLGKLKTGYNYAVLGGVNGLVILDVEDKALFTKWLGGGDEERGKEALERLCKDTLCVDTPHGGIHIYFKAPDIPPGKFNPVFQTKDGKPVADLQSHGSYVVGPGSAINHHYCQSKKCPWQGQDKIDTYTPVYITEIRELKSLKEFLKDLEKRGEPLGIVLSPSARAWIYGQEAKSDSADNINTNKLIAKLKRLDKGKDIDKVRHEICEEMDDYPKEMDRQIARAICHGLTYEEVGLKDRSTSDWHAILMLFAHGVFDPDKILQLLPPDSKAIRNEKWDPKKYFLHSLKKAWKRYKGAKKIMKAKTKTEKIDEIKELVTDYIIKEYGIVTFTNPTNDNVIGIFKWDKTKGIYVPYDNTLDKVIREEVENLGIVKITDKSLFHLSARTVNDIHKEIRDKTLTPLPAEPLRIAFKNATIDWENRQIRIIPADERDESVFAFNYVPHEINIDAINKFLERFNHGGQEITIDAIEEFAREHCPKSLETFKKWAGDKWITLFELIGYALYPAYEFKKAFVIVGPHDSGKSTFLRLLTALLGRANVSSVNIIELLDSNDRFAKAELYHKLVNISSEVKEYTIKDIERLKALTGADSISADRKFRDRIQFISYAKLVIATNELPYVHAKLDNAFWDRWIIIEFNNQFPQDERWFAQTFTEEEMSGVLSTAILALARVFQQNRFDYQQDINEIKDIWLSQKDSLYGFITHGIKTGAITITHSADDYVDTKTLYEKYRDYCYDRGLSVVSMKTFTARLRNHFGIVRIKKKIGDKRIKVFAGVRLNHNTEGALSETDEFYEFVKKHDKNILSFDEIVKEIGQEKAEKLIEWCLNKAYCVKRSDQGENVYQFLADRESTAP